MTSLRDPQVRLVAGLWGLGVTALAAHPDRIDPWEQRAFHSINGLPDSLAAPLWVIMQGGVLGAAPVAAAVAAAARRPVLARRLLVGGTATWVLAKGVKRCVRRPRPAALLPDAQARGRPQTGQGFVSGHAGVAASLCLAALPDVGPGGRVVAGAAAVTIALSRVYVGAHLPLDILGGAALGMAVEAALELADGATAPVRPAS